MNNIRFLILVLLLLTGCSEDAASPVAQQNVNDVTDKQSPTQQQDSPLAAAETAQEISWDDLIPAGYSADALLIKYQDEIAKLEDDSSDAQVIYDKIMQEMDEAPMNESIADKYISLAGFIAPLSQQQGKVTEFLLVPYFGACIHVPPPPVNQTVYIKAAEGQGIPYEEAYMPYSITGKMQLQKNNTDIGNAGYSIVDANIQVYDDEENRDEPGMTGAKTL